MSELCDFCGRPGAVRACSSCGVWVCPGCMTAGDSVCLDCADTEDGEDEEDEGAE